MGIRTDGGPAITGGIITPFYDSLLVKICASGRRFVDAARRMERALQEFRVRGVKTNIPFLLNVLEHPEFIAGDCTTRFIDETPELFRFPVRQNRAMRLLTYAAEITVNGFPGVARPEGHATAPEPEPPRFDPLAEPPPGSRQRFLAMGADAFSRWVREQEPLLVTDTTFRDAHQSLLATRVRTRDMLRVADAYARLCSGVFSIEMWGGATFDTAMRFLKEDPWERLAQLREKIPNILFQMLLARVQRRRLHELSRQRRQGVRHRGRRGRNRPVPRVRLAQLGPQHGALARGRPRGRRTLRSQHLLHRRHPRTRSAPSTTSQYYVDLAKELEKRGANLIAIKDMAGLCKPMAAERLIKALRDEVGVPIHFHTHDIGGAQAASVLRGADVGLDVADGAVASMAGSDLAAQLECDRRIAPVHPARHGRRSGGLDRDEPVLGRGA